MAEPNMDLHKNMIPTNSIKSDINILLLGESGVGKSTFINSFANYLQHTTFETARDSKLVCLIPTRFSIPDEDFVERFVELGADGNEDKEIGNSSTQGTRAYVFPLEQEGRKIRVIDTPGIGDARGIEQDELNFENILSYVSQFDELHAICFLLRPNVPVKNAYFMFCIEHLLSRLEKTASTNIIFVFTNSKSTYYRPGETLSVLKSILKEISEKAPFVEIKCSKENIFCLDNEAFKFLVAMQNGIKFGRREDESCEESWKNSVESCWNMLTYITSLTPHKTKNTLSVNEARRIVIDLSKPLADISDLIQDNLIVLNRQQQNILQDNMSIEDMQKSLYIPVINLRQKALPKPVTVCTAAKCAEIVTVAGSKKYHYTQKCHNPCYLKSVPREMIGSAELLSCTAIGLDKQCIQCKCDFQTHMHILYETELYDDKIEDETIKKKILTSEDKLEAQYNMFKRLGQHSQEYQEEKTTISKSMAKFAHFLKEHSISAYNDSYERYIDYLIERETTLGSNSDMDLVKRYTDLKKQHQEEKNILNKYMEDSKKIDVNSVIVSPEAVFQCIENLYKLKHTGMKIKELHDTQQIARQTSHEQTMYEYCHPNPISKPNDKKKKKAKKTKTVEELKTMNKLVGNSKLSDDLQAKINQLNLNKDLKENPDNDDSNQLMQLLAEYLKQQNMHEKGEVDKGASSSKQGALPKKHQNNQPNNKKPQNNTNKEENAKTKGKQDNQGSGKNMPNKGYNNLQFTNNLTKPNPPSLLKTPVCPPNQFGPPYQHNNFGNQPNNFGNHPNQFGNNPNQYGNHPNQFGNHPNQFGNYPNQFGNNPNQYGNQPNQFGNNPNQYGNNPGQFGPNQNPHNFGNHPRQFPNNPNFNTPNQFGNNSFGNNQFRNPQYSDSGLSDCSVQSNASRNYPKRGRGRGNFHSNAPSTSGGGGNNQAQPRGGGARGNRRGGQFKRNNRHPGNKQSNDDSDSESSDATANIRSFHKAEPKENSSGDSVQLMMQAFLEEQRKLMKEKSSEEKNAPKKAKDEKKSFMMFFSRN